MFFSNGFLFTRWGKEKYQTLLVHGVLQFMIWLAVKLLLTHIFRYNSGPAFSEFFHYAQGVHNTGITVFSTNLEFLSHPQNWPFSLSNLGFTWIVTILFFHLIDKAFVKRVVFISIPYFFVTMVMGNIMELRCYGEMIPVFLTPFLLIFKKVLSET
ncbi:MAG: hypothetical protein V1673_03035 [Candidatus Omnitrophota bacterium]